MSPSPVTCLHPTTAENSRWIQGWYWQEGMTAEALGKVCPCEARVREEGLPQTPWCNPPMGVSPDRAASSWACRPHPSRKGQWEDGHHQRVTNKCFRAVQVPSLPLIVVIITTARAGATLSIWGQIILWDGDYSVHSRMFSSIPSL